MKSIATNFFTILLILLFSYNARTQTAGQLVRINNVADNNAMNAISSPSQGSLVYVSSVDKIYYFDGASWVLIGGTGSTTDTNDDAWGVTGEDIVSDISRTGKVTIGPSGSTDVKLDVNGRVIVRDLPFDYSGGKQVVHLNELNYGELQSDLRTSHSHGIISWSWRPLCHMAYGVVVTGFYRSDNNCSSGHFQFRYQKYLNQKYVVVYNTGNASFSYNASTEIFTVSAPSYCGSYSTEFRYNNNYLEMRRGNTTSNPLDFDLRVEGY